MSEQSLRRWKFIVEDQEGERYHVGPDGQEGDETEWIGTDADAAREADRRADAWERRSDGGLALLAIYASQGKLDCAACNH